MFPTPDIVHQFLFNFPLHFLICICCCSFDFKDDTIFYILETCLIMRMKLRINLISILPVLITTLNLNFINSVTQKKNLTKNHNVSYLFALTYK